MCGDEFPAYVLNSIDGYVEESHQSTVLDAISSFLTSKRYPPPRLLHTIIDILLVNLTACSWLYVISTFVRVFNIKTKKYLAVIEGGWVGCEELCNQCKVDVVHQGGRPRWITPSAICIIFPIVWKPNSSIFLLFIYS